MFRSLLILRGKLTLGDEWLDLHMSALVKRRISEEFFDSQKLIIFRVAITPGWRASFYEL
jgi:hypothetical protein